MKNKTKEYIIKLNFLFSRVRKKNILLLVKKKKIICDMFWASRQMDYYLVAVLFV